jgi:hypothetical protein
VGGIVILIFAILAIICLVFFIKLRKTIFIIGFIGLIGAIPVVFIIIFLMTLFGFFDSGIMRYSAAIMGKYSYTIHDYQYKTKDTGPTHGDSIYKKIENLCDLNYGLSSSPYESKTVNDSGELTAVAGPPYSFYIVIEHLSAKVASIRYNPIILETKSGEYDMYNSGKISCTTWYGDYWEIISKRPFFTKNIKKSKTVDLIPQRRKMEKRLRKEKPRGNEKKMTDDEIIKKLDEYTIYCAVSFYPLPIKMYENDTVKVKATISFIMNDGNEEHFAFEEIFTRYYYEEKTRSPVPLEEVRELDDRNK